MIQGYKDEQSSFGMKTCLKWKINLSLAPLALNQSLIGKILMIGKSCFLGLFNYDLLSINCRPRPTVP
jgi:hypothetical protein